MPRNLWALTLAFVATLAALVVMALGSVTIPDALWGVLIALAAGLAGATPPTKEA